MSVPETIFALAVTISSVLLWCLCRSSALSDRQANTQRSRSARLVRPLGGLMKFLPDVKGEGKDD